MLNIDTNAKTVKGQKYGYMTGVLYLSPYTKSGRNVCALAHKAECHIPCLDTAGRGAFTNVQDARIAKTNLFFDDREQFMDLFVRDVLRLERMAQARGLVPVCRPNGTSDIKWENVDFDFGGHHYANIFEMFPFMQFYDYTKTPGRDVSRIHNYDLTFSYSGTDAFRPYVRHAMEQRLRIAVVFRSRAEIPERFLGMECVDGDDSDLRFLDPQGVVVALYAKGRARLDTSGFVVG
jgi:hypothetical protein